MQFETCGEILRCTLAALALAVSTVSWAGNSDIVDCPLRDEPYSVALPLMEILLKPEAVAVVNRHTNGVLDNMPPQFISKDAPSLSAIVSLETAVAMGKMSAEALARVDLELRALNITDADRRARCARYDNEVPEFDLPKADINILVFDKINGFDHGPSVDAATHAIQALAEQLDWAVAVTDKGEVFNADSLKHFDVVVWNNNSGDVLTLSQRQAFENYIEGGGGYLGIHGAGGDFLYLWDWYADELLGARFIGHTTDPRFQDARVQIEKSSSGIANSLVPGWTMKAEWYSFRNSPRDSGADVVATLDESTYLPVGPGGQDLSMGEDHPIVWTRCVGKGRSMYTAIGHRSEMYDIPENLIVLRDALIWTAEKGKATCGEDK